MLDTKNEARFGPLHGHWDKPEYIQQARRHISYILINSKNYTSGKAQAAWATKLSAKNLREYSEEGVSTDSDLSDETESQSDGTDNEEMKGVEIHGKVTDNVFLSLIQDFGKKRVKESCQWVTVEKVLKGYTHPLGAHSRLPPRDTQFIVVLKGIGPETYKCLLDEDLDPKKSPVRTRMYLKELTRTRVDYVDKTGGRERVGMQNIPLVYGDYMLGSENWKESRPRLHERWQAEQRKAGFAVGDVRMDDVE
jgi:hypothetical protein